MAVALDPKIEGFIERVEGRRSGSTQVNRVIDATHFGEWLADRDVAVTDVESFHVTDYVTHLGKLDHSPTVISNRRWTLNVLFDELVTRSQMPENPVAQVNWSHYADLLTGTKKADYVDARGGIYALEPEGVKALAEHVPEPVAKNKLIVLLMYHTGVRAQELADMKLENVASKELRKERRIEVYSKKLDSAHTQASPWRSVWYGQSVEPHLTRWLDWGERDGFYHADDSPYLFCSNKAERVSVKQINKVIVDAAEAAGLQEVMYQDTAGRDRHLITSHTLRHSFARECMRDRGGGRIDLKTLADLMGHQDTSTTEQYLVFAKSDLQKSRKLYGPK